MNPSRPDVSLSSADKVLKNSLALVMLLTAWIGSAASTNAQNDFQPPQAIDGTRRSENPNAGRSQQDPASPTSGLTAQTPAAGGANGQQVFAVLVQELTHLIPESIAEGSSQQKGIENAVTAFQMQDWARASQLLDELSTNNAGYPPASLLKAALSFAARDNQNGLVLLETASIEKPNYPGVYAAFARLALNEGRITDALALFEKCTRSIEGAELNDAQKKHFEQQCLDGLIDVAMRQQRYDDARTFLERQIQSLPENLKVLMSYAELEFHQNNIDPSLAYLKKIKETFPNARAPETILASWFDQKGNTETAAKWIQEAAAKYPEDPQVLLEYASYLINIEDFPKASSTIAAAEKHSSESLVSRNLKARIAFCNMSYGVAEAHYRAIAEGQPNNFDPLNMFVLSLIESNDEEKRRLARDLATNNFRAMSNNVVAVATAGYVQLKFGEIEQARTLLGRLALSPGLSPDIDFFLACFFDKTGEKDQAIKLLETIVSREGMFIYRKPAQKLLEQLKSGGDTLPDPK